MRTFRTLAILSAFAVLALSATSQACSVSSAMVSGQFNEDGQFVVTSALDSKGNEMKGAAGYVFTSYQTGDDVALASADYTGETIYFVGNLDFDTKAMYVQSYTQSAETAQAKVASVRTANAGAGCCASKAAAASTSNRSASAGSGCSSSKSASAQSASTKVTNASSCGSYKSSSYQSASSGCSASKASKSAAAATSDRFIVFNVSGMTCDGCSSKIQAAVAALELEGVTSCEVSFQDGKAIVYITQDVDAEVLAKAIGEAGFPAELAQADAAEAPAKG